VDDIDWGEDFVQKIETEVGGCDALLVVIGPDWLSAIDMQSNNRLNNAEDYVCRELSLALKRGIPVIPALVDGAKWEAVYRAGALEPVSKCHLHRKGLVKVWTRNQDRCRRRGMDSRSHPSRS
jgi:hypothetical protein